MTRIRQAMTAFGRFWWEFLVGDTPELLVATIVVVGTALALRHHSTVGLVAVPLIAALALALSILRGTDKGS